MTDPEKANQILKSALEAVTSEKTTANLTKDVAIFSLSILPSVVKLSTSGPDQALNDVHEMASYAGLLIPVLRSRGMVKDIKRWILQMKLRNLRIHKQVNYIVTGTGQSDIIREKNLLKNVFGRDLEQPEKFLRLSNYFHNPINSPY